MDVLQELMTTVRIEFDYICHQCIRDPFLAKEVKRNGIPAECSYCEEVRRVFTLDDLAKRIHEVMKAHFELTCSQFQGYEYESVREEHWVRSGCPVQDVIAEIAGVSAKIATDVQKLLLERYRLSYDALKDGEEEPFTSDACYEERDVYDWNFRETWETFRGEVRYRTRFFSAYAEEALTHIFGDLNAHNAFGNRPVIREIRPDAKDRQVWRGRVAQSQEELKEILKSPARKIGPPPSRRAEGGRMNASGIPVFYGAFEKDTCVAELRAPVGSHVVLARFELLRPLRLLDFNALMEIYVDVSHFDPDYEIRYGRAAFLRSLVSEICRPVMPKDEAFEYLPTQVVAEFLANKVDPRLDGIIFPSSQTDDGQNIVLFNHACGVEPDDLPDGTEVKVYVSQKHYQDSDEDEDDNAFIQIVENVRETCTAPSINNNATPLDVMTSSPEFDENGNGDEEFPTWSKPSLRLDGKNLFVLDIKSVRYGYKRRDVFRHRPVKDES